MYLHLFCQFQNHCSEWLSLSFSFSPSLFLLSCLLFSISFSSLLFFHLKPAERIFWMDGIFSFKCFQCLILPHCHLSNHVQMKGEPFWPFALPFLLSLLLGFNGWLKGVLGSLNLVLASVPPRDKVCSQANFHMKAAKVFLPILEFQAASWAPASRTQSFCPSFPHPHPEKKSSLRDSGGLSKCQLSPFLNPFVCRTHKLVSHIMFCGWRKLIVFGGMMELRVKITHSHLRVRRSQLLSLFCH